MTIINKYNITSVIFRHPVLGQLVFGLASFLSPQVYTYLIKNLQSYSGRENVVIKALAKVVPADLPWISLYWVFTLVTMAMILIIASVRFPKVELKEDKRAGAKGTYKHLFKNKIVLLYFFGIFAYVGSEQRPPFDWLS